MTINGICSFNLTLIGINYLFNDFLLIDPKERRVKGIFEKAWSYMLGRERNCRLVAVESYGPSDNKSIKTGVSSFADESADVYLLWQTLTLDSDVGEYSHVVSHETFPAVHPITHFEKVNANFDILEFIADFNQCYFALYFGCIATTFVVLSCLLGIKSRRRSVSKFQHLKNLLVYHCFGSRVNSSVLSIATSLLFVGYLTHMTKTLVANSMKTASVVVETRELISTIKEMETSSRWMCWMEEDEIWINAKGSRAYELIKSKDTGGCSFPIHFNDQMKVAMERFHENGFTVSDESSAYFVAAAFTKFFPGYRYWLSNPILETIQSHYMRKSLPKETKLKLNKFSSFYFEFGVDLKVKDLAVQCTSKMSNIRQESFLFHSLERFIQSHMKLVHLEITAFKTLFLLLFGSQFAIIFLVLYFVVLKMIHSF